MNAVFRAPELAIIIPVYRHSVLIVDAIQSALNQTANFGIKIVIVNDGCPMPETGDVCLEYSAAFPNQIVYLTKPNGGLSSARNFGIRYALRRFPTVRAFYMLDADNLLQPTAMARALAELDRDPTISWIYPNIDMFGLAWNSDYGGDYSLLIHSAMNICEAGSLIHRRVFEAGIFFDTSFRLGWEDWDFFLSMAEKGFRGKNIEHFGFLYRKRPESMLADSNRDAAAIDGAMRLKHKDLFQPRNLIELEQAECPRYAIFLTDERKVLLTVDPTAQSVREVSLSDFIRLYWRAQVAPGRYHTPPLLITLHSELFAGLREQGMLHWMLMRLERGTRSERIAVLKIRQGAAGRVGFEEIPQASGKHRNVSAVCIGAKVLRSVLQDDETIWIDSIVGPNCAPAIFGMQLEVDPQVSGLGSINQTALVDFLWLIHQMHQSPFRKAATLKWDWRRNGVPLRADTSELVRKPFSQEPPLPRTADGRPHVGFLLPLIETGGVEKVALNIGRAMKKLGFVPHAFVLAGNDCTWTEEWQEVFESLTFLADQDFSIWDGGAEYLGTNVPDWAVSGNHGLAVASLYWLDIVINFHGGSIAGIMGQLRRMGITTASSLHLIDSTTLKRSNGNAHLSIAFEHANDYFLPCSFKLGRWLHGMGVPSKKIIPIQNAPGFETTSKQLERQFNKRRTRSEGDALRVLYIGRLDRQKGIERVAEVMKEAERRRLKLNWRMIGKTVVENEATPIPAQISRVLEPAITSPAELDRAYAWADVMILLSDFEGLPLTILEAMRAGVVVIATDVGAVSEVLQDDRNGILLDLDNAVTGAVRALESLSTDRERYWRLSETCFGERKDYDWDDAVRPFVEALSEMHHDAMERRDVARRYVELAANRSILQTTTQG